MEDTKIQFTLFLFNALEKKFEEHQYYSSAEDAMAFQREYAKLGILSYVKRFEEEEKAVIHHDLKIKDLGLSNRTRNCLKDMEIYTVSNLILRSKRDLVRNPNLGRSSLLEIVKALSELGLFLSLEDYKPSVD